MDLTWSAEEDAFRAEARSVARAEPGRVEGRARRGAAVGRHRRGLRPAPRLGAAPVRRRLGGGVVGPRARRPRRVAVGVAPLRGGVLPGRRARPGSRRTASSCWPRPSTSSARRSSRTGSSRAWRAPRTCGARAGRSPTPAATSPRSRAGPARVDGGWVLNGQKTWTTRGAFCTHLFGLFRTDPESARHQGLTYLLVPLDTPGVTVRGFGRLDGDEGFAEVFFDDAFLADDAVPGGVVLGEPERGWAVAMATTGSERGLTLRSPGRFVATAERLVALARERGDAVLRRRAATAWMHAEAYQQQTLQTVTKLDRRREGRGRGEPHQAVVVRARRRAARDRPRPARPRRRARGPVEQGLAVLAVGPDLRRHQRDPAQHRRRAPAGAPTMSGPATQGGGRPR